eukprot:CAMPEP_0114427072 /NCGR_PEP_ID=MMETSP0103-20121206/8146_1 /TAXON_ID=37642 ORGANISM="Paraphysomonas imperforata, Strain PA2" /NCGR_SAMPLE_ID=MMETSP0103 /ASSEMBLY_ACC=CAM_ASM_000201 /LENGTH=125 /DNA_ID=CAMNT_0001596095 /DNA_START=21 /DNA_END=398 /DNA_ORIENTATION=+
MTAEQALRRHFRPHAEPPLGRRVRAALRRLPARVLLLLLGQSPVCGVEALRDVSLPDHVEKALSQGHELLFLLLVDVIPVIRAQAVAAAAVREALLVDSHALRVVVELVLVFAVVVGGHLNRSHS